jgi:acyl-coenzyme A thioesterase PaaI-like protein
MIADEPGASLSELEVGGTPPFAFKSPDGVMLCFGCRNLNRCRLGLLKETLQPDGAVISEIVCPPEHEGGPQVAHGGWTAGIFDELVGHTLILRDEFVVTGTLEIVFAKPIPVSRPLIGRATVARREGRRVFVTAELTLASNGALLGTANAVMVRRPPDHFDRHQKWLSMQNGEQGGSTHA